MHENVKTYSFEGTERTDFFCSTELENKDIGKTT